MSSEILNDEEKKLCNKLLDSLRKESDNLLSAILSSQDGLLLAHSTHSDASVEEDAIAAMSASVLSLADALAGQAGQAVSNKLLSEADDSSLVILHAGEMILTVIGTAGTNMGMVLQASHHVVDVIEKDLSQLADTTHHIEQIQNSEKTADQQVAATSPFNCNMENLLERVMKEVAQQRNKNNG